MTRFTTPDSYRLKLRRSKEHCLAVARLVRAHLQLKRRDFVALEINEFGDVIARCTEVEFNPSIFLAAADCLVNLRACLDHLVCQIVAKNGVDVTKQAFPICDKLDDFNDSIGKGLLKGVPFEAISILESQQPYDRTTGVRDDSHPLFVLRELSNTDKHRAVYLASPDLRDLEVFITSDEGRTASLKAPGPFRQGQVVDIGTLQFQPRGNTVNVLFRGVNRVTFEEFPVRGAVVTKLLSQIIEHVETVVVPALERFAR
jgi:hypothetical protein